MWDLTTGQLLKKLGSFADMVESLAFSADGSALIAGSRNGLWELYSTSDYSPVFETTAPGGISTLALSPDGGLLATGNNNGDVNFWKIVYRP